MGETGGGEEGLEGVAGLFLMMEDAGGKDGLTKVLRAVVAVQLETMRAGCACRGGDLNDLSDHIVMDQVIPEVGEDGEDIGGEAVLVEECEIGFSHGMRKNRRTSFSRAGLGFSGMSARRDE